MPSENKSGGCFDDAKNVKINFYAAFHPLKEVFEKKLIFAIPLWSGMKGNKTGKAFVKNCALLVKIHTLGFLDSENRNVSKRLRKASLTSTLMEKCRPNLRAQAFMNNHIKVTLGKIFISYFLVHYPKSQK